MRPLRSNATTTLEPGTSQHTPELAYDFPAIRAGISEYVECPAGCKVVHIPGTVTAAVDIRGGSPSVFATDNHHFSAGERILDALCFTGGSVHGLEAVTG